MLGSGGREHALAWKLAQSPHCTTLWASPGNPGVLSVLDAVNARRDRSAEIGQHGLCFDMDLTDHAAVLDFCATYRVDLVVIGPEAPLVDGLADSLRAAGIAVFGPSRAAAQLEGSKGFTKDLCTRAGIPTAGYVRASSAAEAHAALARFAIPVVIKADGLAAGKGVVIALTAEEATAAIDDMFGGAFGGAGAEVVIEEFLEGEEVSLFALTDGNAIMAFGSAQDHKRVGEGDTGPNTGGMGAYSPAPVLTPELEARAMDEIIAPTVKAMAEAGMPYSGVLFAGLMLTADGPKLIEYNCRFGDPECQVLMLRLESDLVETLAACARGQLAAAPPPIFAADSAMTVVVAAKGYPGTPAAGGRIEGLAAAETRGAHVFHAGTALTEDGALIAKGGRVLNVAARGRNLREARDRAYRAIYDVRYADGFWRSDIGWRGLMRLGSEARERARASRPSRAADVFRQRGARRLALFHCDHFEPWRNAPRTIGPENAALIERFAETTAAMAHAQRLTLFYRPHVKPIDAPRAGGRFVAGDPLGFARLRDADLAVTSPAIRALVAAGHELQLHIHHERVTRNTRYTPETRWADHLETCGEAADSARLELLVQLSLEAVRAESGLAMDTWLFVHGNWALAASDPRVCGVEDELAILQRNGCAGDFTFLGEPHDVFCLPDFTAPSLVKPVQGAKAYDRAEAEAIPAWGAEARVAAERLFIWSAAHGRDAHSLDYTSLPVIQRASDPSGWATELAQNAVLLGDTLYLGTYAHSMSPRHGPHDTMVFPHAHPPVRRMLETLHQSAAQAGLAVAQLTASEVRAEILASG